MSSHVTKLSEYSRLIETASGLYFKIIVQNHSLYAS